MKLTLKRRSTDRVKKRMKNKARIRRKVSGTLECPRLTIYRSAKNMYAQIVDDVGQRTLVSASTLKLDTESYKGSIDAAKLVGQAIAKAAIEKNITNVVFDRSGYVYHGRVKAVAEGAREAGLKF